MRPTAERWRQIEAVYSAALGRPEGERDAFLNSACSGDVHLRREVVSLLQSPATEGGFPAVPAAATVTADPIPAVAPVSRSHNLEGRQLGSYRIAARLGAGGMGDVYRAYDQTLHRR